MIGFWDPASFCTARSVAMAVRRSCIMPVNNAKLIAKFIAKLSAKLSAELIAKLNTKLITKLIDKLIDKLNDKLIICVNSRTK